MEEPMPNPTPNGGTELPEPTPNGGAEPTPNGGAEPPAPTPDKTAEKQFTQDDIDEAVNKAVSDAEKRWKDEQNEAKRLSKPDGTEVYEYQPDCGIWLGTSKILTDDENAQLNISSFDGLGKINFEANSVMKNGSELATVSAVDNLKREIQQLQLKFLN